MESELDAIRIELEALLERVDDYALDVLRAAVREGADNRPEIDRQLARVRRALERAIAILRTQ